MYFMFTSYTAVVFPVTVQQARGESAGSCSGLVRNPEMQLQTNR